MTVTKQELRKLYRKIRNSLPESVRKTESETVCRSLIASEVYRQTEAVFCYLSYGSELETAELIQHALSNRKTVAVPKIQNNDMVFCKIDDKTKFCENQYGIAEPETADEVSPMLFQNVLLILPGLCYDNDGGRLGYGGGFYDKYIARYSNERRLYVVSLALSCQHYDKSINMEPHDVRPDLIIYPDNIWKSKGLTE